MDDNSKDSLDDSPPNLEDCMQAINSADSDSFINKIDQQSTKKPQRLSVDATNVTKSSAVISQQLSVAPENNLNLNAGSTNTANITDSPSIVPAQFDDHIKEEINEQIQSIAQSESTAASYQSKQSPSKKSDDDCNLELEAKSLAARIPENILSPPKSETHTDETNTATSSSPASESQLSPIADLSTAIGAEQTTDTLQSVSDKVELVSQPINVIANGTIPNSGKPLMLAMNKKLNKSSSRLTRQRKSKPLVAMYESEISDNKIGIKLCIKKSDATATNALTDLAVQGTPYTAVKATTSTKSNSRKRSRKSKFRQRLDSDDSEYETRRKKGGVSNNSVESRQKKVAFAASVGGDKDSKLEPVEQGDWGARMPEEVLYKIFQIVVSKEGCLPTLFKLGRVCSLWRRVSLSSTLWKTMDLATLMKEKYRTELKLKWFIDNRCSSCLELNVSNWKVTDINCFLNKLALGCLNLTSINLSGWKNFTSDHLTFLVDNMKKLERLDLSSVNFEMNASKSAVGLQSLCYALQTMNGRLTHLYLAHNRLAGIPQIVNILSTHCPNLILLDLSNVHTQATSHGILHIEKLQHGCQKLKVLRVTNSHVSLSAATLQETMDSPGFPDLEELSVAALLDESRIMGDEHLQRILKNSSKLKLLDVRGCSRLTHESLIRLPAWDIKHLFLSYCSVTRDVGSGLELIASKWAHSLIELDLAWANVQHPLDNALRALAEKGSESPLAHLNLCGSSVSDEAVKDILANCANMSSINLSSCRGLPRGVKRLMQGPNELQELRDVLKVQMKVKLPAELKREQEEALAAAAAATKDKNDADGISGDTIGVECNKIN